MLQRSLAIILLLLGAGAAVAKAAALNEEVIAIDTNSVDAPLPHVSAASSPAAKPESQRAATKGKLRRNSRLQAAMALNNATTTMLIAVDPPSEVKAAVVCGANSLRQTSFINHCRIVITFPDGVSGSCSAAKVGGNRLATAGHCIYSKPHGGWARAIDVYCSGVSTCTVARTTTVTDLAVTPRWMESTTTEPNAWDVAVIRTAGTLPGTELSTGQYASAGRARARLTGYTASKDGVNGCKGYTGCIQYSSTDTMTITSSGLYTSNTMDSCAGNSGGGVVDGTFTNVLVAIVSGESTRNGACVNNLFAPSLHDSNVNEGTTACTRSTGGASIPCLSRLLPA